MENNLGQAIENAIKAAWGERGGELEIEDGNDDYSSSDNDSSDGSASESEE